MESPAPITAERETALQHIEDVLEGPMNALAFLWLGLTIWEFTATPPHFVEILTLVIWGIFWFDFILKFLIAPKKVEFLRHHWITLLSLIVPAFRIFRVFRFLRVAKVLRGGQLIRTVGAFNRGMSALRRRLRHRKFGYIALLTLIVNLLGAAAIYALEKDLSDYFADFATALWWTAMMLTTMGSDYFPKSTEGRWLGFLLATYGFAIFGYVTATLATFFMAAPAEENKLTLEQVSAQIEDLRQEIIQLKKPNRPN